MTFTEPLRLVCLLKFMQLAGGSGLGTITRAMNLITAFELREFCRNYWDSDQSGKSRAILSPKMMLFAERDFERSAVIGGIRRSRRMPVPNADP